MTIIKSDDPAPYATQCDQCCNTHSKVALFDGHERPYKLCEWCLLEALEELRPDLLADVKPMEQ